MKIQFVLLASLLGASSAFSPAFKPRNGIAPLNAVAVETTADVPESDDTPAEVAETPVVVEEVAETPVVVEEVDLDKVFGVSVETGGKCTPLGKALLSGAKPEAVKWFQNAEIKHGRIAMVAVIGFLVQKLGVHFPLYLGPTGSNCFNPASDEAWMISTSSGVTFSDIAAAAPLDAIKMVPGAGWLQIFVVAGWFECVAYNRQYNPGFEDAIPGNYGYDPLGFTKREGGFDSPQIKSLRLKEIKNGRVAMLTIAAWVSNEFIPGAFPLWHP
jgi:hypothetical protein